MKVYVCWTAMYNGEAGDDESDKDNIIAFDSEKKAIQWVAEREQEMKDYWDHKITKDQILYWNENAGFDELELK